MTELPERPRMFLATWQAVGRGQPFLWVMQAMLLVQQATRHDNWTLRNVLALVAALAFGGAFGCFWGFTLLSVRASSLGIHFMWTGIEPWSSVVKASRKGQRIEYEVILAPQSQIPVAREIWLSPALAAAIREWLPAEHPIRHAIESGQV